MPLTLAVPYIAEALPTGDLASSISFVSLPSASFTKTTLALDSAEILPLMLAASLLATLIPFALPPKDAAETSALKSPTTSLVNSLSVAVSIAYLPSLSAFSSTVAILSVFSNVSLPLASMYLGFHCFVTSFSFSSLAYFCFNVPSSLKADSTSPVSASFVV